MKHLAILFLLFSFVLVGCTNPFNPVSTETPKGNGGVSFALLKSTTPSDVASFAIELTRSGYPTISESVSLAASTSDTVIIRVAQVPVGVWHVRVTARDTGGVPRYVGEGDVEVFESVVQRVTITMRGTGLALGTAELMLVWPEWVMSASNPVLSPTSGTYDAGHSYFDYPCVIRESGVYKMWYTTGYSLTNNGTDSLFTAYATSPNGINWTKQGIVLGPAAGTFYSKGVSGRTVIHDSAGYMMWFDALNPQGRGGIGLAVSADGKRWTVNSQPAVAAASKFGPWVVKVRGTYHLYYTTTVGTLSEIGHMTSSDPFAWEDRGRVLGASTANGWERYGPAAPCVVFDENKFKMYYTAYDGTVTSVGYAESADGTSWAGRKAEPELSPRDALPWNVGWVGYPSVLRDSDGKLKMWFGGYAGHQWRIGCAVHR